MRFPRLFLIVLVVSATGSCRGDPPPGADADVEPPAEETTAAAPPQALVPPGRSWRPIRDDYLHDPTNPGIALLQEPAEALSVLPEAREGNQVDWAAALREGLIDPRTNIHPETDVRILDLDILFEETAGQPMVLFPHRPHTEWLDCNNCHDKLFIAKKGANDIAMLDILNGYYCGQCHGAVSFPLTQCFRCHSVDRPAAMQSPPASPEAGQ